MRSGFVSLFLSCACQIVFPPALCILPRHHKRTSGLCVTGILQLHRVTQTNQILNIHCITLLLSWPENLSTPPPPSCVLRSSKSGLLAQFCRTAGRGEPKGPCCSVRVTLGGCVAAGLLGCNVRQRERAFTPEGVSPRVSSRHVTQMPQRSACFSFLRLHLSLPLFLSLFHSHTLTSPLTLSVSLSFSLCRAPFLSCSLTFSFTLMGVQ